MKKEISDKLFAKGVCRSLFVFGLGDCWYEAMDLSRVQKILYAIWMFISNAYLIIVVFSEVLANLRSDLTLKENNDCIQFSMAHTTVLGKFLVVYLNRFKIRKFYQRLIEDTRTTFSASSEAAAVRKSKVYIGIVTLSMILCLSMTTVDGIMFHFREGIPVRTLVTYWPKNEDRGWFVSLARVATQFHWWYLIAVMVASDSVCITALIYLGFKFRSLRLFFLSLKRNFEENVSEKNQSELVDEYLEGFVKGIQLHDRILWCAKNLQTALGNVYSFQVVQSITLLSMCLIKLVSGDRSFTFILANTAFILCLLALTGTYMMAAGEITCEASLVPVCIFQSGWERCGGAPLRPLLVMSLMRSQAPVVMTAFGIFDLSYRNFISILRSSYSFFAVMY
uniref:Odorant receptor n=1 Tax=Plutella xylostella TaxID=51655 RepID=A0A8G1GMU5_PLUXY|nr:odorant receptor 52 [Plutella xylostella]